MKISDNGNRIEINLPIETHGHGREGLFMRYLVGVFIECGWRGVFQFMPNLGNAILTGRQALSYLAELLDAARPHDKLGEFKPLVSVQITPKTTIKMLEEALALGIWLFKIYPLNVTTNSEHGVMDYRTILPLLRFLEGKIVRCYDGVERRSVVMLHPESPKEDVEGLYKEQYFIDNELQLILDACPDLSISVEHISTAHSVRFMEKNGWGIRLGSRIVATVPVQYMCSTLDDVAGYSKRSRYKLCPHEACKPMFKLRSDMEAIVYAATSDRDCYLCGNDNASHKKSTKEGRFCNCGTANSWASIPRIFEIFDKVARFDNLDAFLFRRAALYHKLPISKSTITVVRKDWVIPDEFPIMDTDDSVVPWLAGETMHWQVLPA